MNHEIRMSVSAMTGEKEKRAIYVLFQDGEKSAEFALPEKKLLRSSGFSGEEIAQLAAYLKSEQEAIVSIAGKVHPMKGFLGEKQGE